MKSLKITAKEKALAEHYIYAVIASAFAIYQTGHHNIKFIAASAIIGVIGPVIARFNPSSLVNKISADTGLPVTTVAPIVTTAVADVQKVITQDTPKA